MAKGREEVVQALTGLKESFSQAYMCVCLLRSMARCDPDSVGPEAVEALAWLLRGDKHVSMAQVRLLYREAALTLTSYYRTLSDSRLASRAHDILLEVLFTGHPLARLAVAALGALPVAFEPSGSSADEVETLIHSELLDYSELLEAGGLACPASESVFERAGRSLIYRLGDDRLLVIKTDADDEVVTGFALESWWMEQLRNFEFPVRFDIPQPVRHGGHGVFRLENVPGYEGPCWAMAYTTHGDYFRYPNDHREEHRLEAAIFAECMERNAHLLGHLAGQGIVHTAAIPLFHNRVQQFRRSDAGHYEWRRMGRLDRWLESCRYPNLGLSGLRDFEHLERIDAPGRELHTALGNHLLSLVLVAGSWFRAASPERGGFDGAGNPVDTRDLFDEGLFADCLKRMLHAYCHGFSGNGHAKKAGVDYTALAAACIREMGVDTHMEEVLRAQDQEGMSQERFEDFLESRGMEQERIRELEKGAEDISVLTGPHLGGFNREISLPELVEFASTGAALCIAGKYDFQSETVS